MGTTESSDELADLRKVLARERSLRASLQAELDGREADRVDTADRQMADRVTELEVSASWQIAVGIRDAVLRAVGGAETRQGGLLRSAARRLVWEVKRRRHVAPEDAGWEPLALHPDSEPLVSIVVPVHNQPYHAYTTLKAISLRTTGVPYEVIVVDDASGAKTADMLRGIEGIELIRNEANLGFLGSCNAAVHARRGDHVLFLNSDTEVGDGWLEQMVATLESAGDVGVVGAKLRYPSGQLQEAGCVIWDDATGGQVGKFGDPGDPRYSYAREVDYCSGACLLVRGALIDDTGGFDERYAPGYYEDTDLCFEARSRGYRVLYQPLADVIHHEGATSGTDESAGMKRFQARNQPRFFDKWQTMLSREHYPPGTDLEIAAHREGGKAVLVVDHKVPEWNRDSGSLRMLMILGSLRRLGYRVVFIPGNGHPTAPYTEELEQMGVEVFAGPYVVESRIRDIGGRLTAAIVSRPDVMAHFGPAVRHYAPRAQLLYDTVDLHYVRERRRAELTGGEGLVAKSDLLRAVELALVGNADVTLVVTDAEREILEAEVPNAKIRVLPNANQVQLEVPDVEGRDGILFVGGFEHTPNADAVVFLVEEVMPSVWDKLPNLVARIVGSKAPPEVEALASERVRIEGWVEDLEPLIDGSRASVAPLRYGAGMKGKVSQSLAAGLPVVTTSVGAEGLGLTHGVDALIADDPDRLAAEIVRICRDDQLWQTVSAAGLAVAEASVSPAQLERRLGALLEEPAAGPPDHELSAWPGSESPTAKQTR